MENETRAKKGKVQKGGRYYRKGVNSWEEISKEEAEEEEWGEDDGKDDAGLFEGLGSGSDEMRSFEEVDDEEEDDGYESLNPFDFNAKVRTKPDDYNDNDNNDSDDDKLDIKDLVGSLGIQEERKASSLFDERHPLLCPRLGPCAGTFPLHHRGCHPLEVPTGLPLFRLCSVPRCAPFWGPSVDAALLVRRCLGRSPSLTAST